MGRGIFGGDRIMGGDEGGREEGGFDINLCIFCDKFFIYFIYFLSVGVPVKGESVPEIRLASPQTPLR